MVTVSVGYVMSVPHSYCMVPAGEASARYFCPACVPDDLSIDLATWTSANKPEVLVDGYRGTKGKQDESPNPESGFHCFECDDPIVDGTPMLTASVFRERYVADEQRLVPESAESVFQCHPSCCPAELTVDLRRWQES